LIQDGDGFLKASKVQVFNFSYFQKCPSTLVTFKDEAGTERLMTVASKHDHPNEK
jgi:hypothetical protein